MLDTSHPPVAASARFGPLHGAADALALARRAAAGTPIAVVCGAATDAQRLVEEIRWFAPALRVALLPDWETLPYDSFSPHADLVSERLETLYRVTSGDVDVLVVPASTALYRLPPASYLAAHTFFVRQAEKLDLARLREQLTLAGYTHATQVVAPGEYCIRGGLIDLFPMGSALPYRIDLADEEIESIRTFDPDTQRTVFKVGEIRLLPAREFPMDEAARNRFRARFRETFEGDPSKSPVYRDVSNGVPTAGIEYYLPLFFDSTATLFDYLPQGTIVALHRDVPGAIDAFWRDAQSRHRMLAGDRSRPVLPPAALFLPAEQFYLSLREFQRLDVPAPDRAEPEGICATVPLPDVAVERRAADPVHKLKDFLDRSQIRVLLAADSPGRRETMAEYLAEYGLPPEPAPDFAAFARGSARLMLSVAPLDAGFVIPDEAWAIVTEAELYAGTARARERREQAKRGTVEGLLRDLSELRPGDPVVHTQHGVGLYRGLVNLDLGEGETEFLLLEYADADKLYVPVAQLHVISRYTGGPADAAPLHKLGSGDWDKAKRRAAQKVRDTAAELLHLYAQRAARKGHAFKVVPHDLDAFAEGFGFEETPDQAGAIAAVVEDLRQGKPMDRLVCGDVGFGKTEVALRAAFVAVADGKQVAVLAPTTLLTEQHFQTFSDRFAGFPVRVAELSRFRTGKESAATLAAIAEGRVDIVIGTHKLLSKDVKFPRLGLVIVDEEHRFGVRQKETLKALRAEVDVLTLTATPIPRTLAMSLEGLRDLSVIATAPAKRLAIKTFVSPYSQAVIREAALRELKRGGQIYFLHNDVDSIEAMRERLATLLPEARLSVAHGQMPERELERVMREFVQQRANVLVCSTIIETGLDIPTANTIIINRADKFGLAQLHQLRGRVGRSHHQAYHAGGEEAARSDPDDGRARLGLLPRHARPRNPRRRRGARREPVRRDAGSGLRDVRGHAQPRGQVAQVGPGARPHPAVRRRHGSEPAHARAAAGGLLLRRARAAGALQAPRQHRDRGRASRDAGGARGSLRHAARAGARARRMPSAAHPRQAARHGAARRHRRDHPDPVRSEAVGRPRPHCPADPEAPHVETRRTDEAAHRGARPDARRARRCGPRGTRGARRESSVIGNARRGTGPRAG